MQRSESIVNLVKALAVAQAKIQNPRKNTKNTFFSSMYADLAEVLDMIRTAFDGTGLSLVQMPTFEGDTTKGALTLETTIFHESGEWIASTWTSPVPPQTTRDGKILPIGPQAIGSATTYMRRYAATAIVGIAQDDDDGEGVSDPNRRGAQDHGEDRRPQQPTRPAQEQAKPQGPAQGPKQWSIEEQEQFAILTDRLYKAFKVASTMDKYNTDAERWRVNMAKDPASKVLPAMLKWTEDLETAAAKKTAQPVAPATDTASEPAA